MDVRSLMRQSARVNQKRTAIVEGERRLTYGEAWQRGLQLANGLLAAGLVPGDKIGTLEDNALEAQDSIAGAAIAGMVRVPLYARNTVDSHLHMLRHTGCRALIVARKYLDSSLQDALVQLPALETVIVQDDRYEAWLRAQLTTDPNVPIKPGDLYIIRHSGGSTGKAKGIASTHQTWINVTRDWFYNYPPVVAGDAFLHLAPISHGSGYLYFPMWFSGGVNVLLPQFDAGRALELLERERIAFMLALPAILSMLVRHPDARKRDFSSLKALQVGGAPIQERLILEARDVFGMVLYQAYGQTEAVPATLMSPQEWFSSVEGSSPLQSAGRPFPFALVQIRDPDDPAKELPIGVEGEIAIQSDGQMVSYWNDPEMTQKCMTADGFVLTADIGKFDENGYLYVLDRKDDMIVSGGFNIWPFELENVILHHPDVIEVAAFAVPSEKWGETPLVVCYVTAVDPEPQEQIAAEIIERCRTKLGSYKKPSRIVFWDKPLPRSPVGKIDRKALREPYWAGYHRRVS